MENEKVILNEDVVDGVMDVATDVVSCGKFLKVIGITGIGGLAGFATYKFAVKPMIKKIKEKRANKNSDINEYSEEVEVIDVE